MAQEGDRLLIWGGYGHGNAGDWLTLAAALHDCGQAAGGVATVLSPDPVMVEGLFPEARAVRYRLRRPRGLRGRVREALRRVGRSLRPVCWRFRYRLDDQMRDVAGDGPAEWVEALGQADRLYLAGGGYLTELFDLERFVMPLLAAQRRGLAVATAPIGIGPFRTRAGEALVADALRGARVVVRDDDSAAFCRRHGLPAVVRPDDGFRVREVRPALAPPSARAGHEPAKVGVCACPQYGAEAPRRVQAWWGDLLCALRRELPAVALRGFCFHTDPTADYQCTREAFQRAGLERSDVKPPRPGPWEAVEDVMACDALATARFHAAVVAGVFGVPCLAVASGAYSRAKMESVRKVAPRTTRVVDPGRDAPADGAAALRGLLISS